MTMPSGSNLIMQLMLTTIGGWRGQYELRTMTMPSGSNLIMQLLQYEYDAAIIDYDTAIHTT